MEIMELEEISGLLAELSLKDILIGDTSALVSVVYFILMISLYSIIIWHFYRFLSRRDCFSFHHSFHPRIINMLKYMFCFPFVAFIFFIGLSFMLLFITKDYDISILLTTAFAYVAAVRIVSYYSEDLARDLSKMLPLAILALVIVDPAYFSFADIILKIVSIPLFFALCIKYILYIVLMEWILRVLLSIRLRMKSSSADITSQDYNSKNIPSVEL
jgi:hypothetical protein